MPNYPGHEGSIGPFKTQFNDLHVYARDVHSGSGNCVCGRAPRDMMHPELVPGVPNPDFEKRLQGYTFIEIAEDKS